MLIENNSVLSFFEKVIKEGAYPNMRMLRNDIEDAINFGNIESKGHYSIIKTYHA